MYATREAAGEVLAEALSRLDLSDPVVLALPRGGVPVALPVARALSAPLDLILVRKIGLPRQPELAAGALVEGPPENIVWNEHVLRGTGLAPADLEATVERERASNAARSALILAAWRRASRAELPAKGRTECARAL